MRAVPAEPAHQQAIGGCDTILHVLIVFVVCCRCRCRGCCSCCSSHTALLAPAWHWRVVPICHFLAPILVHELTQIAQLAGGPPAVPHPRMLAAIPLLLLLLRLGGASCQVAQQLAFHVARGSHAAIKQPQGQLQGRRRSSRRAGGARTSKGLPAQAAQPAGRRVQQQYSILSMHMQYRRIGRQSWLVGDPRLPAHLVTACPVSPKRAGSTRSTIGGLAGSRARQMRQVPSKEAVSRASGSQGWKSTKAAGPVCPTSTDTGWPGRPDSPCTQRHRRQRAAM